MALSLANVAILVPEYDPAIDFFTRCLGLVLLEDLDMGGGKRWVRVGQPGGGAAFLIARAVGDQRASIGQQGGGRVWLFLHSDDFDRDHAAMLAEGVHFEETPRTEIYGKVAVFRDPWANRWDLIGPAPQA